jgi:peptidoglycan/LPS O-acetylase OafA/YrhL
MQIDIINGPAENLIFINIFLLALILSVKKFNTTHSFTPQTTEELKGLAILAVLFSHIGYFLISDHRFLFPLSTIAGVGVNLFLFLSGMGLTFSSIKQSVPIFTFYLKRLPRLFLPMWIVLSIYLLIDWIVLQRTYPVTTSIENFLGFFPRADLFLDINSPLWYFTMILFYYLIYPLVFHRKIAYLSPLLLLLIPSLLFKQDLPITKDVLNLYKVHLVSFPLGVLFALIIQEKNLGLIRFHFKNIFLRSNLVFILIPLFLGIFSYTSIHSGVGLEKEIEQTISLITMFSIIFLFIAKNIEFKLFHIFGKYSYEIYLLHWPLLSRYDLIYKYLPASIATIIYLVEFILLAYLLQKSVGMIIKKYYKFDREKGSSVPAVSKE